MGKVKRARQKFHNTLKTQKPAEKLPEQTSTASGNNFTSSTDNIFDGLNINVASLKTDLSEDAGSVKSSKSTAKQVILPKKNKLKLRREALLKKIDTVNQTKKALKLREKRKTVSIIGDTNPLHDALPSLESLLKNRPNIKYKMEPKKKKGIEKAGKRKKALIEGVNIYKAVLKNKIFQESPSKVLDTVTKQVKIMVAQERSKVQKK